MANRPHRAETEGRVRICVASSWRACESFILLLNIDQRAQVAKVRENTDASMRLSSVRVVGAHRTRPSFLNWLLKPHLDDMSLHSPQPTTLSDILKTTRRITANMLETDVFTHVVPRLEASRDPMAHPGDLSLLLQTRQKGRFFLKTATELGDQEGSVSLQMRLRNALGGAETLEAALSSGLRTRLAGHFTFGLPVSPDLKTRGEISVFGLEKDLTALSSCVEGVRGLRAAIRVS
jgi:outer membrane protein insertion porin family